MPNVNRFSTSTLRADLTADLAEIGPPKCDAPLPPWPPHCALANQGSAQFTVGTF